MDVGVQPESAAPSVEDIVESDLSSKAFWIFPEFQQGLGGALKQQVIHYPSVVPAQRVEDIRQCENAVVIGYWKQIFDSGRHPSVTGDIISARTMAVPAGIVSFFKVAACVT